MKARYIAVFVAALGTTTVGHAIRVVFPHVNDPTIGSDVVSEALATNDYGEVVAWSGPGESSPTTFVTRTLGGQPVNLNDKHFVHGWSTAWNLKKADAVHNAGWIVGEGTFNGQTRGFLLRKLQ